MKVVLKRLFLPALTILLAVSGSLLIFSSKNAQAAPVVGFQAGNIVSDAVFVNYRSMSVVQIQSFLNSKVPYCDTQGTQPSEYGGGTRAQWAASRGYSPPFTCLKDYRQNNKSAAQIIYDVAQEFKINPQVFIVLLQKEQGLVTDEWPLSIQYKTATGYGCPDTAPCDTQYYGFTNQLRWSGRMFRSIMDDSPTWYAPYTVGTNRIYWHPDTGRCGSSQVNIVNRATAALYNYTPYRPNQAALNAGYGTGDSCSSYGNRNFYQYFKDWFGSVQASILLQAPQSSAVYLQSGSNRYGIPASDTLKAYGLESIKVTPVTNEYMNSLVNVGVLGTLARRGDGAGVYLADNGYRFGISSSQQCATWGLPDCTNQSNVAALDPSVFDLLISAGDLRPLMLNGSVVFKMENGKKRPFLSGKALSDNGYNNSHITPITSVLNRSQAMGDSLPENRSFVKFGNNPLIYLHDNGKFYSANSMETYKAWFHSGTKTYHDTGSGYASSPPTATDDLKRFIYTSDGNKYVLSEGKKYSITSSSGHWPTQTNILGLDGFVTGIPNGGAIATNSALRTPAGYIFMVSGGKVRPFLNLSEFNRMGYTSSNIVGVPANITSGMSTGDPVFSSGYGVLFQVDDPARSSLIYSSTVNNTSCSLKSVSQLGQFRFNTSAVPRMNQVSVSNITNVGTLSSLVLIGSSYYVIASGVKYPVSEANLKNLWGMSDSQLNSVCKFSNGLSTTYPTSIEVTKFIRVPSGEIFYLKDMMKHSLSYKKFLELGGNSGNTPTVMIDIADMIGSGPSIN